MAAYNYPEPQILNDSHPGKYQIVQIDLNSGGSVNTGRPKRPTVSFVYIGSIYRDARENILPFGDLGDLTWLTLN